MRKRKKKSKYELTSDGNHLIVNYINVKVSDCSYIIMFCGKCDHRPFVIESEVYGIICDAISSFCYFLCVYVLIH